MCSGEDTQQKAAAAAGHDVLAGMIGMDVGGAGVGHDPSADSGAAHLAVSRLTIGSWNLVSKHDEHILLSFYWAERKLVWEVLHAGVVRKMEVGFEDVHILWEGTDKKGEGNGVFKRRKRGEADDAWIVYVVGRKPERAAAR